MELALKKKKVSGPTTVYEAGDAAFRIGTLVSTGVSNYFGPTYLYINSSNGSGACGIYTDLTQFKTAHVILAAVSDGYENIEIGVTLGNYLSSGYSTVISKMNPKCHIGSRSTTDQTLELDLSAVSGNAYFLMASSSGIKVKSVIFE